MEYRLGAQRVDSHQINHIPTSDQPAQSPRTSGTVVEPESEERT
jgi:hypothetical protein